MRGGDHVTGQTVCRDTLSKWSLALNVNFKINCWGETRDHIIRVLRQFDKLKTTYCKSIPGERHGSVPGDIIL